MAWSTSTRGEIWPVRTSSAVAVASRSLSCMAWSISTRSPRSGARTGINRSMDGMLAGRLALVTVGGRGIGAAIARALAKAGARVVVCGRTKAALDTVARDIGGVALRVDLTDRRAT